MALVLGVGVGVFILILFWVVGIVACVTLSRTAGSLKVAAAGIFVLLIIITVIMVFWPRKTKEEELAGSGTKKIEVDRLAVLRTALLVISCVFAVIAFGFLVVHWAEPLYSPALTSRKTYAF